MSEPIQRYYESFSHDTGLRDWAFPNARHEQLRLVLGRLLDGRSGLRILDVGCGTGVMAAALTRYGRVDGNDLSAGAVALAAALVPEARFRAGRLEDVDFTGPYDLITLFDVLEHVPREERGALLGALAERLAPGGTLFASTPQGDFTRWLLDERPELAQVIEVEVQLAELLAEAAQVGLALAHYETYEIQWARQYQAMAFERPPAPGAAPRFPRSLRRRSIVTANPVSRTLRRVGPARRLAAARGGSAGLRLLLGRVPATGPDAYRRDAA